MKRIIFVILFVAISFAIFAQKKVSDYDNTAVPNGTDLLLIARHGSPGTNLNITFSQLYSVVTTNVLSVSNAYAIAYSDDTNSLIVYSVGDVASRGTYYYKDTVGGISRYTNSLANGKTIGYDPDQLDFGSDNTFALTNGLGVVQYASDGNVISPPDILPQHFTHQAGTAPDGVLTWGTNVVTTFQPRVTTTLGLPIYREGNIWFVRTNGNDNFVLKGREDLPAATLYRVATNAVAGDVIDIGPGTFSVVNWGSDTTTQFPVFDFPHNLTIRGAGKQVTFIVGKPNASTWHLGNSNVVQHFTSKDLWYYDRLSGIASNIFMQDIEAAAGGDVVVFNLGAWFPVIEDCDFSGNSDKIAEFDSNPGYFGNNVITILNTRISGGGATDNYGIRMAQSGAKSVWKMYGVHVDAGIVADRSTILAGYVGMIIQSNLLSTWPSVPRTKGDAFWGNSNGVVYLLTSTPSGTTWGATNKIAP